MARPGPTAPLADRIGLWPARLTWATLPVTLGPALTDTLAGATSAENWVAAIVAWGAWFFGLLTLVVPSTAALTAIRILGPLPLVAAVVTVVAEGWSTATAVGLLAAAAALAAIFQAVTGDAMVNGSAYGSERRLALRPPAPLLLGPLALTWLLTVGPLLVGIGSLARERWVLGVVLVVVGLASAVVGVRSLHLLSRRWLVFVPAGVVLHDRAQLVEPILLKRTAIERLGPAPADSPATDLTGQALGLALRADFRAPVELVLRNSDGGEPTPVDGVLFTPSLPGRVLTEARIRGIKIA